MELGHISRLFGIIYILSLMHIFHIFILVWIIHVFFLGGGNYSDFQDGVWGIYVLSLVAVINVFSLGRLLHVFRMARIFHILSVAWIIDVFSPVVQTNLFIEVWNHRYMPFFMRPREVIHFSHNQKYLHLVQTMNVFLVA